jgi:RNA ligase
MEYHKIQSVFKRDPETKNKLFLMGQYSLPEFEYLKDNLWEGTEKVDGTNVRLGRDGTILGKTDNASLHTGLLSHLRSVSNVLTSSDLPDDLVLYGEGYGAKIQSGGQYLPDRQSFVLFDVMISGNFQPRKVVQEIGDRLGILVCPVIARATLLQWIDWVQYGSAKESYLHPGARNEGVVLRPVVELQTRDRKRVITKLKFKDFI